ncbi:MAG: hypothetical protein ACI9XP_000611 [Lentimonas sp.]|jgi:hypothetical protein
MKKTLLALILLFCSPVIFGQDCETIVKDCEAYLLGKNGKKRFISDGQVYTAFLDREQAEFKTTFYGGSTYRIAASAGRDDDYVVFTVLDMEGNLLFTNKDHKNANYWDFEVTKTIPVVIRTELDLDLKVTGCAIMLIGFK